MSDLAENQCNELADEIRRRLQPAAPRIITVVVTIVEQREDDDGGAEMAVGACVHPGLDAKSFLRDVFAQIAADYREQAGSPARRVRRRRSGT